MSGIIRLYLIDKPKRRCPCARPPRRRTRRERSSGAELIEFSMTLGPFLMLLTVIISISWAIFAKSSLQYAVKVGVREGITIDKVAAGSSDLTTMVKNIVVANSFGFLKNTSLVHVHYYQPPSPSSSGNVTDVSSCVAGDSTSPCTPTQPGNSPGNIMVVSVDGYSLSPLVARIFSWNSIDRSTTSLTVSSADLIEQLDSNDLAPLGTAP